MIKNKRRFTVKTVIRLYYFYFKTAPSLEEQTNFAYLANQPYFMFGSFGIYSFLLFQILLRLSLHLFSVRNINANNITFF